MRVNIAADLDMHEGFINTGLKSTGLKSLRSLIYSIHKIVAATSGFSSVALVNVATAHCQCLSLSATDTKQHQCGILVTTHHLPLVEP